MSAWEGLTVRLEGQLVVLEPLESDHGDELFEAAQAPETFQWLAHIGRDRNYFDAWMELTLVAANEGREGPFAVRRRADGHLVGSSRYLALRPEHRALEIGWTWFHPSAWRTGINRETKLLLLGHAFEDLGCVRVEFKTDARNERSRTAIAALPAQFEGVFRNHMIVPDVGQRDSAFYSVVDSEWPEVRANLERRPRR